jgi:hypothetical protein
MSSEEAPPADIASPKKKPDVRVYLEEKVFPVLTRGLEELLRAVEDREKKLRETEEEEVPEVQPLLFLARYLMRHAPQNSDKTSSRGRRSGRRGSASSHASDSAPSPNATDL